MLQQSADNAFVLDYLNRFFMVGFSADKTRLAVEPHGAYVTIKRPVFSAPFQLVLIFRNAPRYGFPKHCEISNWTHRFTIFVGVKRVARNTF